MPALKRRRSAGTPQAAEKLAEAIARRIPERSLLSIVARTAYWLGWHQHVPDRRPGQGVDELDVLLAWNAENGGDALPFQAAHEQIRDTKLLGHHESLPPDSTR